ncbi:hypothetical protein JMJ77_0006217 [Colletotrichum scovillei]|uniref:Uncharacterized protein n=1 Tax=Colletotrichum scovillei TaxID=1209932 RepID=A0A9P7RHV3_9PEZI|nr:hypothetical protein JMJ77_0006217 [Colletotrichum scovillei]KAG7077424.1 hypothetical protein JMJ76_0014671 [Colletotrichum scovillei]KAG7084586.1 hypothetical protein JMJ78_0010019 [Colletotrichum scovillei]
MAWCGPVTVVSSENRHHFNHLPMASHAQVRIRTLRNGHCGWRCHPAVLNAAFILMQHKPMKLQGTNWKGQSKVRTQSPACCPRVH